MNRVGSDAAGDRTPGARSTRPACAGVCADEHNRALAGAGGSDDARPRTSPCKGSIDRSSAESRAHASCARLFARAGGRYSRISFDACRSATYCHAIAGRRGDQFRADGIDRVSRASRDPRGANCANGLEVGRSGVVRRSRQGRPPRLVADRRDARRGLPGQSNTWRLGLRGQSSR